MYKEIFKKLFDENITINIKNSKAALLRTQFESTGDGVYFIYGLISKFTDIKGDNWINLRTREGVRYQTPPDLYPDLQETRYVFVPSAHRVAIVQSSEFSLKNAQDFFIQALKNVLEPNEEIKVYIETSTDAFEEILSAEIIKSLVIEISYTNADITTRATRWMDSQLKGANVGDLRMELKPDASGSIDPNTDLINGALGMAQSNGEVTAQIVSGGKSHRIVTKDYPRKERLKDEGNEIRNISIVDKILSIFRPQNDVTNEV